jgi:hypothetical protein
MLQEEVGSTGAAKIASSVSALAGAAHAVESALVEVRGARGVRLEGRERHR